MSNYLETDFCTPEEGLDYVFGYMSAVYGGAFTRNWEQVEPRADGYIPHTLSLPQHHGVLWWRAHLAMWLMQPKPALALRLRRMKSELGWRGHVIGVHVRRGDACFHAQTSSYRPPCAQWEE